MEVYAIKCENKLHIIYPEGLPVISFVRLSDAKACLRSIAELSTIPPLPEFDDAAISVPISTA